MQHVAATYGRLKSFQNRIAARHCSSPLPNRFLPSRWNCEGGELKPPAGIAPLPPPIVYASTRDPGNQFSYQADQSANARQRFSKTSRWKRQKNRDSMPVSGPLSRGLLAAWMVFCSARTWVERPGSASQAQRLAT